MPMTIMLGDASCFALFRWLYHLLGFNGDAALVWLANLLAARVWPDDDER